MQLSTEVGIKVVANAVTYRLTDHGRSPIDVDLEIIEREHRTAKGQRKVFHVADKRIFSVSWENIPWNDSDAADWYAASGVTAMSGLIDLFEDRVNDYEVDLTLYADQFAGDKILGVFQCNVTDFNYEVVSRRDIWLYNASIEFTEV